MKKKSFLIKCIAFLLVSICAMTVMSSPVDYTNKVMASSSDSKVKGYEDRIAQLKKDQASYEKELKKAKQNAANYMEQKRLLDEQLANLTEQMTVVNDLVIEYNNAITAKEEAIAAKEKEIEEMFKQFEERMRTSYEEGTMGYLAMLLSSDSMSEFLTSIERMTNMLDYDKRMMKKINDEKTAILGEKQGLEVIRAVTEAALADLKKTEEDMKAKADEVNNFFNQATNSQEVYLKKIEDAKKAEEKANAELDAYLKELANKNNGVYEGGAMAWPLPQSQNKITSKFGHRTYQIYGKWVSGYHRGIDIGVPTGTQVMACASGTVETAGWNNSYGYYVVVSHGSGYTTLYAHNSRLVAKKGQKVKKGDLLAYSGSTGNSSGPHLHLEISINGVLQDPLANGILSHPKLVYYC
ncbi:MAG: hypothetical protein E7574_06900 [Ruminococcaceae bacterium]|nr:hypothetical protein [Oscillospiraceae bacterium]